MCLLGKIYDNTMGTQERKDEHLALFKQFDLSVPESTNGFEKWEWIPAETAELHFDAINPSLSFLGYSISFPLMIAALSGGSDEGNTLNKALAECAEMERIPLGIGSVRSFLENYTGLSVLQSLRKIAPNIPLITNIGIAQLKDPHIRKKIVTLTHDGQFDAIAIHFNKIQELIQPEGDTDFTGMMDALSMLVEESDIPIIAKQVGHGFSGNDIRKLWQVGIRYVDLGGRGGTSWARAERFRKGDLTEKDPFDAWGPTTAYCLKTALEQCPGMLCIAGGGIHTGHDVAKGIALGARLCSTANSIYQAYLKNGREGILNTLRDMRIVLKQIMFLTGCSTYTTFHNNPTILRQSRD